MAPSGTATIAMEWSFLSLSFLFVSLRIKAFLRRGSSAWIPEVILVFGLVVEIGCVISDTLTNHLGGMPEGGFSNVPVTVPLNKLFFVSDVLFYLGIFLPKSCLLAFYHNLVPISSARTRIALKCITVYVAVCALVVFFVQFAACRPLSTVWSTGSDYCALPGSDTFFDIHCALNISCDVMIFVLPFFLIHSLHLPKRQKYGVYGIFLLGAITISIAISRFISVNVSPEVTPVYIWGAAEYCGSMVVVCLPSLKTLIKGLGDSVSRTMGGNSRRRTRMYNTFPTFSTSPKNEGSSKNGVTTTARTVSEDWSQVELKHVNTKDERHSGVDIV